jgi:GT2 family glycosyltransferase
MGEGEPHYAVAPGPVCGSGIWVGRVPDGAVSLSMSPVKHAGPFGFSLDRLEGMSRLRLVAGALRRNPGLALRSCWLRLKGKKVRARHFLASIWASTPFERYADWSAERSGRLGADGPDAVARAARIGLVIESRGRSPQDLERTLRSLPGQGASRIWITADDVEAALAAAARHPALPAEVAHSGAELMAAGCDWLGALRAGDVLGPDALACFAAAAARDPRLRILYSDEDRLDAAGRRSRPVLKPDWSPLLQAANGYLGGLTLVRCEDAPGPGHLAKWLARVHEDTGRAVGHVRRILLHRWDPAPEETPIARPAVRKASALPSVSVVIPNKDRLPLLRVCLGGLLTGTDYPATLDVVVVDNGSTEPATRAFYGTLQSDPRVTILERPGPFNFSALTNAGIAASRGEVALLLNNDIEVIGRDWLQRLVVHAAEPDVGAVGAKLLYPDGRVQHAGVAIGLGGEAGHVYRGRPGSLVDRLGRLGAAHEVSAVTGACLAVERTKYEAVGGLDEELFPVSFNDIDLCLKLRAQGLRNILVPDAVLYHHESASRGPDIGAKQARAEREARHFAETWRHVMRDDPFFHPGLSLLRFDVSLG